MAMLELWNIGLIRTNEGVQVAEELFLRMLDFVPIAADIFGNDVFKEFV